MRAILFDFGGTLDYPRHWLDRFMTHYRAAGIILSRAELDRAFDSATRIAYHAGTSIRDYGLARLVRYLVRLQLDNLRRTESREARAALDSVATGDIEALADRISESFTRESIRGLDHSRRILAGLRGRFRIGVVSNFYGNLDRVLAEAGLDESVDAIADSCRLGIFKPDPGIFQAALANLDVAPREAAMVGDSLSKDCLPAARLGLTTVWLKHQEAGGTDPPAGKVDFTISALAELDDLKWPA